MIAILGVLIFIFVGMLIFNFTDSTLTQSKESLKKRNDANLVRAYKKYAGSPIPVKIGNETFKGTIVGYNIFDQSFIVKSKHPLPLKTVSDGDVLVIKEPGPYVYVLVTLELIASLTYKTAF